MATDRDLEMRLAALEGQVQRLATAVAHLETATSALKEQAKERDAEWKVFRGGNDTVRRMLVIALGAVLFLCGVILALAYGTGHSVQRGDRRPPVTGSDALNPDSGAEVR